jgi:ATP-dependent 26S proteasome regulatory subunit
LAELDGVENRGMITVLFATNNPDAINNAFLRSSRIDYELEIGPPNYHERKEIFKIYF